MNDVPSRPQRKQTSPRKAAANRRNASKSTGPRTPQGKSWARLNALKHGILASQAVIATIEGRAERKLFEATVEGLAQDFQPVGAYEQLLVQEIAACFWRKRRLLMFENRAAFQSRDNRTFREMNQPQRGIEPLYAVEGDHLEGTEILDQAGLGLDLPGERDTMRLIRYESSITRSLRNALAQLKASQQARGGGAQNAAARKDRAVVVDKQASNRNRGPAAERMGATRSRFVHRIEMEREEEEAEEEARLAAAERKQDGDTGAQAAENYQTKPNIPEDPEALLRHQRLLESADAVLKLSAHLAPKPRPSGD
jgi:hypothetical protein